MIRRMCDADETALGALYDRWMRSLYSLVFHLLKDADEAEDVVEETFWQAWRKASSYEPSRGAVSTWLLTIGRRRALDRLRAKGRRREEPLTGQGGALADMAAPGADPLAGSRGVGAPNTRPCRASRAAGRATGSAGPRLFPGTESNGNRRCNRAAAGNGKNTNAAGNAEAEGATIDVSRERAVNNLTHEEGFPGAGCRCARCCGCGLQRGGARACRGLPRVWPCAVLDGSDGRTAGTAGAAASDESRAWCGHTIASHDARPRGT